MQEPLLSIVTPTYNRAYILPELYSSLLRQVNKNFEWIVIDDGSIDNTANLIKDWIDRDNGFEIRYLYIENGGKHKALNRGIPLTRYNYIYIIDSDDYLSDNAISIIYKWISTIKEKDEFAGVSGLRGRKVGVGIHGSFPFNKEYIDATNLERKKYKLLGDKAEIYRRDLLLMYPFPEYENENFLGEAAVWDKIASEGYKIRWFNEIVCLGEYLEDGLTHNDGEHKKLNNFMGYTYIEKQNTQLRKFPHNYLSIGRYIEIARRKGKNYRDIRVCLEISRLDLLMGICMGKIRHILKKHCINYRSRNL